MKMPSRIKELLYQRGSSRGPTSLQGVSDGSASALATKEWSVPACGESCITTFGDFETFLPSPFLIENNSVLLHRLERDFMVVLS